MNKQQALFTYCLRLADTSLIHGQRLAEWCGHGPFLEEDLAITNISLDLVGRASAIYKYAAEVQGLGKTEDDLAFFRNEREFYNLLISELPKGDFAYTISRTFFISAFDYLYYNELLKSNDETLAGIAAKSIKEITYHLRHTTSWMERLGDGTEESNKRLQNAINDQYRFTGEMFEMDEVDNLMLEHGIGVDAKSLQSKWQNIIDETFSKSNLVKPENVVMQTGSRKGLHTENLGYILAIMQSLPRAYPEAKW
ncbi:MAG: 1,2-phenylacetyl-CoA epoxidase subunit PaaC [Bacteroidia bacterium]